MSSIAKALRGETPLRPYCKPILNRYPLEVVIPKYVAKLLSTQELLQIFTATCITILVPTWLYIRRMRCDLPTSEVLIALWFVLCGSIHTGLKGYFAFNCHDLTSRQKFLAQLWKEYAYSDSRYPTADTFAVCIEAITAVL
ncbi:Emopamil binding protein-domain-containing protein [Xylariaceae sp. FL0255]|nr:Emopamil binding protein-domain-containing protein [Xylariaceae sp. FL0255]